MDPARLTRRIRRRALELGFSSVGVAPAAPTGEELLEWLARGYQGSMAYMSRTAARRSNPQAVLEGVRSILCLTLNYFHPFSLPYGQPERGVISRYAWGQDYHELMLPPLEKLLEAIREEVPGVGGKVYVDTGPVMEKYWGARAGLGWIGKHTNLLSRQSGSWFFLGEILLDIELEYDAPLRDQCGSCTRCIEACPTEAIVAPYRLDARRCISYLTIELREDIPEVFRPAMGNLIFGCDICQDVCPWNRRAPHSAWPELAPRRENLAPRLRELARLTPQEFRRRFRGTPVLRAKWRGFLRNVVVAMGNTRDPELVPDLVDLLECGDEMVRRHVLWALRRIASPQALQAAAAAESQAADGDAGEGDSPCKSPPEP